MQRLLYLIAVNGKVEIELSRFVTARLTYKNGNIEFLVDNHGPIKPGVQKVLIDKQLDNNDKVLEGIWDIKQVQDYTKQAFDELRQYNETVGSKIDDIKSFLTWNENTDYDENEYLSKILNLVASGSRVQIDSNTLLAFDQDEMQFKIVNFERVAGNKLEFEVQNYLSEEVAKVLVEAFRKNKDVLCGKVDEFCEKKDVQNADINKKLATLRKNFFKKKKLDNAEKCFLEI